MRTLILFKPLALVAVVVRMALVAVVLTACVACGQKGPLVLPSDPPGQDRTPWPSTLLPEGLTRSTEPAPRQP